MTTTANPSTSHSCSWCGALGHKKPTCTAFIKHTNSLTTYVGATQPIQKLQRAADEVTATRNAKRKLIDALSEAEADLKAAEEQRESQRRRHEAVFDAAAAVYAKALSVRDKAVKDINAADQKCAARQKHKEAKQKTVAIQKEEADRLAKYVALRNSHISQLPAPAP